MSKGLHLDALLVQGYAFRKIIMTPNTPNASMEGLREEWRKYAYEKGIGYELAEDWWIPKLEALLKEAEERIKKESIYRIVDMDAVWVAKAFHDFYESYADLKGWKTQEKCRVEFDDLPEENKATMICTASAVLREMAGKLALENMGNGEFCKECKCFCGCHPCIHTKGKLQSLTEPSK